MNTKIDQTPTKKLNALYNIRQALAKKFLELGQILSDIKQSKSYRFNGYESFADMVHHELDIPVTMANKLVRIYRIFVHDMDHDEDTLLAIGMDKLQIIAGEVDKSDTETRQLLLELAQDLTIPELKTELAKRKAEAAPETPTDLKKVLVDQWKEWFTGAFNASWSEVQFKLALWFSSPTKCDPAFLKAMKDDIRVLQARFEEEAGNADR